MSRDVEAAGAGAVPGLRVRMATGIMAALAIVLVAVLGLMAAQYVAWKRADPLNRPELLQLRREFIDHPDRVALKEKIRVMDLSVRREYFDGLWHLQQGAWLLLLVGGVMLVAAGCRAWGEQTIPDVGTLERPEAVCAGEAGQRRAIAVGAAVGLLLVLLAGVAGRMMLPGATAVATGGSERAADGR
jgi:hypothetical protein